MTEKSKGLLSIHIAIFLFGFAGIFPKIISLPIAVIMSGRVLIAAFAIGIYLLYTKQSFKLKATSHYWALAALGALYAIHAVAFYLGIRLSTVAIGLLSSSTFPVFVALLEPIYLKEPINVKELPLILSSFAGLLLVIPQFDFHYKMTLGVCWGVLSGFLFANYSILNRKLVQHYSSLTMLFYQDLVAGIILDRKSVV